MRLSRALVAVVLATGSARVRGQTATVRDAGPGPLGRTLEAGLAGPHHLVAPPIDCPPNAGCMGGRVLLPRDSTYDATVIVLAEGRSTVVEGHVRGDVIAVGGDLFVHAGARIDARAIAIGGAVYPSTLAIVGGGIESHRDVTFDVARNGNEYALRYRELRGYPSPPLTLPGVYGFGVPLYDRSDGLSLTYSPLLSLDSARFIAAPAVTYRSQLGAFDPSLDVAVQPTRRFRTHALAARATLTNDAWIWSDIANSAAVLYKGLDTRNYYRADRADVTLHRLFERPGIAVEPFVGARWERAGSVRPEPFGASAPWTISERHQPESILRPNPPIDDGHIASLLFGTDLSWESDGVRLTMHVAGEGAFTSPRDQRFVQAVVHGTLRFPTFAGQRYLLDTHLTTTAASDAAPRQRWGWLGGSGTFPLLPLLSLGGDQVFFLENDYFIPIPGVNLPLAGQPGLELRYILGSAGVHALPSFEQNLAFAVAVGVLRVELDVDPARHRSGVGVALSMTR